MKKVLNALLFLLVIGCGKRETLTPVHYVAFLEQSNNGFRRTITSGKAEYLLQLATPEYMALKSLEKQLIVKDTSAFNMRLKELENHIFFVVRVKEIKESGVAQEMVAKSDAERMVMYYQGAAANDFTLLVNGLERRPVTYMFENNYSLVSYNTIVVGFEADTSANSIELVFNDRYHNNPYIKSKFSKKEMAALPTLTIK